MHYVGVGEDIEYIINKEHSSQNLDSKAAAHLLETIGNEFMPSINSVDKLLEDIANYLRSTTKDDNGSSLGYNVVELSDLFNLVKSIKDAQHTGLDGLKHILLELDNIYKISSSNKISYDKKNVESHLQKEKVSLDYKFSDLVLSLVKDIRRDFSDSPMESEKIVKREISSGKPMIEPFEMLSSFINLLNSIPENHFILNITLKEFDGAIKSANSQWWHSSYLKSTLKNSSFIDFYSFHRVINTENHYRVYDQLTYPTTYNLDDVESLFLIVQNYEFDQLMKYVKDISSVTVDNFENADDYRELIRLSMVYNDKLIKFTETLKKYQEYVPNVIQVFKLDKSGNFTESDYFAYVNNYKESEEYKYLAEMLDILNTYEPFDVVNPSVANKMSELIELIDLVNDDELSLRVVHSMVKFEMETMMHVDSIIDILATPVICDYGAALETFQSISPFHFLKRVDYVHALKNITHYMDANLDDPVLNMIKNKTRFNHISLARKFYKLNNTCLDYVHRVLINNTFELPKVDSAVVDHDNGFRGIKELEAMVKKVGDISVEQLEKTRDIMPSQEELLQQLIDDLKSLDAAEISKYLDELRSLDLSNPENYLDEYVSLLEDTFRDAQSYLVDLYDILRASQLVIGDHRKEVEEFIKNSGDSIEMEPTMVKNFVTGIAEVLSEYLLPAYNELWKGVEQVRNPDNNGDDNVWEDDDKNLNDWDKNLNDDDNSIGNDDNSMGNNDDWKDNDDDNNNNPNDWQNNNNFNNDDNSMGKDDRKVVKRNTHTSDDNDGAKPTNFYEMNIDDSNNFVLFNGKTHFIYILFCKFI